jgi:hypothetical protein
MGKKKQEKQTPGDMLRLVENLHAMFGGKPPVK